jgi:predicted acetyltransferase
VPEFSEPTTGVQESFLAAMAEFQTEGRGAASDESAIGREIRDYGATWHTPAGFAAYVRDLRAQAFAGTPLPDGLVPCTTLWWIDGPEYLGRLAIRHRLNAWLLNAGGHIGYDVRPSARRRGHATAMLGAALPRARNVGLDRVLVTCDDDNVASRKVIESCGGVFEDQRGRKLRYWLDTA